MYDGGVARRLAGENALAVGHPTAAEGKRPRTSSRVRRALSIWASTMLHVPVLLSLRENPKLDRLMEAAGLEHSDRAMGWLVNLWLWGLAQEIPADGALPPLTDTTWGKILGCPRAEAPKIVAALEATGWLDRDGDAILIHDWHEHAGGVLIARESEREADRLRKAEARRKEAESARRGAGSGAVRPESDRTNPESDRTLPESGLQSNPSTPRQSNATPAADTFDEFYGHYPVKKDKEAARKAWKKLTATQRAHALLAVVLFRQQYDAATPERRQFTKYPATWLNKGSWEDMPTVDENAPTETDKFLETYVDETSYTKRMREIRERNAAAGGAA